MKMIGISAFEEAVRNKSLHNLRILTLILIASFMLTVCSVPSQYAISDTTFQLSFDNESVVADHAMGNPNPIESITDYQFTDGIKGRAISIAESADYHLAYEESQNLDVSCGTVMFWVKPKWNPEDANEWDRYRERMLFCNGPLVCDERFYYGSIRILYLTQGSGNPHLGFSAAEWQQYGPLEGKNVYKPCDISYWNKGEWHHIAYAWDCKVGVRIYIDGMYWRWQPFQYSCDDTWQPTRRDAFRIGCHRYINGSGLGLANADIDELYIYNRMLNEDEIKEHYRELMPVDISAQNTVLLDTEMRGSVSLEIANKTDRTVSGDLEWRFYNESGTIFVALSSFERRKVNIPVSTPSELGRHYLNCTWSGDTQFHRTIRLFAINGNPVPSRDQLTLSPPIEVIHCSQEYPDNRYCDTGDAGVANTPIGQYRQTGTAKNSAFAYNFNVEHIDKPHLLVVEYPDDAERTMEIILNSPKYRRLYEVQAGVFTGGSDYSTANQLKEHKIIFWPRDVNYSISIRNPWEGHRAAARKMTLYEIEGSEDEGWFPTNQVSLPGNEPNRLLGLWWEDARVGELFGGRSIMIKEGNPIDEFYRNLKNIMDYIHYTGQNLIIYPIYMYVGPHYPSNVEEYLSHWRRIYHPDNWVEVILRACEVNNVNFIPSISMLDMNSLMRISSTSDEINQVNRYGHVSKQSGHGKYTVFNPVHPIVQENILAVVDEILDRYAHFSAFKGVSLYFWANTILWFGSLDCSYDDYTWSLFALENQSVPDFTDPDRFSRRYAWVMDENHPDRKQMWVDWRGEKVEDLILKINAKLRSKRDDLRLIISGWLPYTWVATDLKQWDGDPNWMYRVYKYGGLDLEALNKIDGIVVEQVMRLSSYRERMASWGETHESAQRSRDVFFEPTYYKPFAEAANRGAIIYNGYFESGDFTPKYPDAWGETWKNKEGGWIGSAITPGHKYFMENYMLAMSNLDPLHIGNGGYQIGMLGHEDQVRDFAKAYLALPARSFQEITHANMSDFQLRELKTNDKHYFYIMNKGADPVQAELYFDDRVYVTDLVEGITKYVPKPKQYFINLDSYELRSYYLTPPRVRIDRIARGQ